MYKLSKIELENFRVFKGKKPFELSNRDGKPYNFICIYGPNGSGKTALVDALEWLATGKLHRITSDMQVQGKTYEGAILTHLEAYEKRQWANVTAYFIDSDGNASQHKRSVRPRADSVNDYLSGSCSGQGLSPIQILPHSRVAGFVSAEKPEQRFSSWAGLINPEDQSFSLLANTYRLRSKMYSLLEDYEKKQKEITTALSNCMLDAELISVLNNAILSYNKICCEALPQEKQIAPIQKSESGIYQIPDLSSIKGLQLRVSGEIERLRTREHIFRQLIEGYPEYHKSESELANIDNLEKSYREKVRRAQQKKELDTLRRNVDSLYDTLTYLFKQCVDDINEQIRVNTEQKDKVKQEEKVWRLQIEQIEKEAVEIKESDPTVAYQDAVERQEMLKSSLGSLSQVSKAVESQKLEIASTHVAVLPQIYRQEVTEKINKLIAQDNTIQSIVKQRIQISQQIQEAESSCSEVIASIEQIRAQIINTQLKVCPVCQTEFASAESLLTQIKQEFCSKDLAEARAEYRVKDELLKSSRDSYQSMVQSWELTKQFISKELEKELSALNREMEEISAKVGKFNSRISQLEERRQMLRTRLNATMGFTGELTLDAFDLLIKSTYQHFDESHLQNQSMLDQLRILFQKLRAVNLSSSQDMGDKQRQLETALYLLPTQSQKTTTLKATIQEYISKIDQLLAKQDMLQDLSEVNSDDLQTYQTKVNELAQQHATMTSVIGAYHNLLLNAQLVQQKTIEEINQQFFNENKDRENLEATILPLLINILSHETELLTYQKQYQNLIQQKGEFEKEIAAAKSAFNKIDDLYNSMCSIQQKVVDQAFSGEMVNKLYSLLEPSKDFPRLSFEIGFNSSERPELYINAHDRGENDSIVLPELIFSTAQLNTISLCLFLSNALSNSGLDSQTLILDDPISSFDDINTVAFCDLLRILCVQNDWQIIFTTHDEKLFRLLQVKLSSEYHNSLFMKFIEKGELEVIQHSL